MKVWVAIKSGYSFCIVLEEKEFKGWTGYSLSWKKLPDGKVSKIPRPFYRSYEEAVDACEKLALEMLNENAGILREGRDQEIP